MFIFDFLFLKWIFGTSIALYVVYYAYWELTIGTSRRRMMKAYGCKPITWSSNGLFGLSQYREFMKAWKKRAILDCLRRQIERDGSTSKSRVLHEELIITVDPENLKTIMATKFKDWNLPDLRKKALRPLLGDGIFTTDGTAWQHSRDLLRPNFVRSQVGDLNKLEVHVSHFLQAIPRDRSTVDLQELFFRLTLDSATEFLFGESTYCLAPGTSKESNARFASAFNRCQEHVGEGPKNVLLSILPFTSRGSQHQRDLDFVHLFVDRYVQLGFEYQKCHGLEKAEDDRYVFLHELVRSTQDPIQIRSELLNILLAGRDTTASLLSNTLFMLAKKPTIWAKLRREVENLGGVRPTYQQIKDLKYLKAVLNETLRLFPVVPGNARMAVVDTVLPRGGGLDKQSPVLIPAKTTVSWSVYTMHRRKDYYGEDADEYRPERWETLRPGWEYLPFNGGPRICIGQQYALTEASYTIIRLMQEFNAIESRDPEPWTELLTIVCASFNGAKVALTPS